jgi:hypothetical protein
MILIDQEENERDCRIESKEDQVEKEDEECDRRYNVEQKEGMA